MYKIQELQPERVNAYDGFINNCSGASIYHTRPWMDVLRDTLGVMPRVFIALEGKDIVGTLPIGEQKSLLGGHRLVSLPFSHLVCPLGSEKVIEALIQHVINYSKNKKCSLLELRCDVKFSPSFSTKHFMNTDMSLAQSKDILKQNFRPNTRQKLNQARRNKDLHLRLASESKDFREMDDIMALNRRNLGSLTYPKGFFKTLAENLKSNLRCEICYYKDLPIAMMVTSKFGKNAIHHYGASKLEPDLRRLRPNNLLIWNAICWAKDMGAEIFDFGTSLLSQKGLISFKEGWGGLTRPLSYKVFPYEGNKIKQFSQEGQAAKYSSLILKKLPLSIYKLLTPGILKALG